jgi:hypothetical protein
MHVHSVFFWLKPDLTAAQRAEFLRGIESLTGIKSVEKLYVGTPAPLPPRPVVDATYTYAMTVVFKNVAGHDRYQVDPIHKIFLGNFRRFWIKVQIYDAV